MQPQPPADDTIVAVASPPGISSRAVIRVSGPHSLEAVARLVDPEGETLLRQRGFTGRAVELELDDVTLPAWVNVYRAPRSYTREDVVELFVCGSPAVLHLVSTALLTLRSTGGDPLLRWARPGEFTLRAFLRGRIDLSQAEAVASVIGATGEDEARAARRGLRGELRDRLEALSRGLTESVALLEAALDFPDEDLPQVAPDVIRRRLDGARSRLEELRSSCRQLSGADGTLRVVLAGFPNAGKSTLLNAILCREAAIATPVPGTTRDPVRGVTICRGRRVEWIDLAGTRSAGALTRAPESMGAESEEAEGAALSSAGAREEGQLEEGRGDREMSGADGEDVIWRIVGRLSKAEVDAADLVLWVLDPVRDVTASLSESRRFSGRRVLLVAQKSDLLDGPGGEGAKRALGEAADEPLHLVSALRGDGIAELLDAVLRAGSCRGREGAGSPRFLVSAHQQAALEAAGEALGRARGAVDWGYELAAADLRDALRALEDLTGRVTSDAILEEVFSRFCIGK